MSKSVNSVVLLGYLGQDPEMRSSGKGTIIANLSLATSERVKESSGDWADKTEWHSLVAFGKTAELLRDYVHKGSKLYIEGKLQTRSWEDRESGKKLYKTEVVIREVILLDGKGQSRGTPAYPSKASFAPKPQAAEELDDIPF